MQKPTIKRPKVKKPSLKKVFLNIFITYDIESVFIIGSLLFFGILSFIFGGKNMSIISYLGMQICMLFYGLVLTWSMTKYFGWNEGILHRQALTYFIIGASLGLLIFYLSKMWTFLPLIPSQYYASLLVVFIPLFWQKAFDYIVRMPSKIYKGWTYPYGKEIPIVEVIKPIKIKFYIAKKREDDDFAEFALNVPTQYKLGDFMHYFLHRYNYDKNPNDPIFISPDNKNENLYRWLFRAKPGSLIDKEVYDPNETFESLGLKQENAIIVERYFNKEEKKGSKSAHEPNDLKPN